MKKLLIVLGFTAALLTLKSVHADQYGCNGVYGQYGSNCVPNASIMIEKSVGKPVETKGGLSVQYVDNISPNDYKFKPGENVYFQLKVKNTSDKVLNNVIIRDTLPAFLDAQAGAGGYDKASKVVTIEVGTLQPNEEKIYTVKTVVLSQNSLPSDKSLVCMTNTAKVSIENASDEDSAQFCVEKQVINVNNVPATGPEFGFALLGGQLALLGLGFKLKKSA